MAPATGMEASSDQHWLLGEPGWWNLGDTLPPDFRPGELAPPESWVSSTPRIGNFGWIRQRFRPLAWPLLMPMSWSPLFLLATALPLAFPGRTPNDQAISFGLFAIAWALVLLPLILGRNAQPMSNNSIPALPVDWFSLALGAALFSLHILLDPWLGWISYALFWIAYIRTVQKVQDAMITPSARLLLPIVTEDWNSDLPDSWESRSKHWVSDTIARASCDDGHLVIAGTSRGGSDFLALAFVHRSGFVQDPFHDTLSGNRKLAVVLAEPLPITGTQWPSKFIVSSEEE